MWVLLLDGFLLISFDACFGVHHQRLWYLLGRLCASPELPGLLVSECKLGSETLALASATRPVLSIFC